MRGIENIIAMRQRGVKPAVVWVEMLPMQQWAKQLTNKAGRYVDIHVDESDVPSVQRADLRCLVGLQVMVNGPDNETTEKVAKACFDAGAKTVQAFRFDISNPYRPDITKATRYSAEGVTTSWPK